RTVEYRREVGIEVVGAHGGQRHRVLSRNLGSLTRRAVHGPLVSQLPSEYRSYSGRRDHDDGEQYRREPATPGGRRTAGGLGRLLFGRLDSGRFVLGRLVDGRGVGTHRILLRNRAHSGTSGPQ